MRLLAAALVTAAVAALLMFLGIMLGPDAGGTEEAVRAALQAGTGVVELPAGTIEISHELEIPQGAHDLEIRGATQGSILRVADGFQGRSVFVCESGVRIRFSNFTIAGNRSGTDLRASLPAYDVPFEKFTRGNGILAAGVSSLEISGVRFARVAGFAVLVSRSSDVTIAGVSVEQSGGRNPQGRNNTTGGILLEEGTSHFQVLSCDLRDIRGNGIWTHSLYPSPRNSDGHIAGNRFHRIGRDAIQVGHAVRVRVEDNTGSNIGFPFEEIDRENHATPVGIDTAGNTSESAYVNNRFEEINGKCIDLDGFHHGKVQGNHCINRGVAESYPDGNFAIGLNNSNPDVQSEKILISQNEVAGTLFGAIFAIGSGHTISGNHFRRLNLAHCAPGVVQFGCSYAPAEPDFLRSGIYWATRGERPAPARNNVIRDNEFSGFGMAIHCIAAAPGIPLSGIRLERNVCRDEDH